MNNDDIMDFLFGGQPSEQPRQGNTSVFDLLDDRDSCPSEKLSFHVSESYDPEDLLFTQRQKISFKYE